MNISSQEKGRITNKQRKELGITNGTEDNIKEGISNILKRMAEIASIYYKNKKEILRNKKRVLRH